MKTLLLVRHAKSSWENLSMKDFDRPLNGRGKKDAPAMAKYIRKQKQVVLDAIVSSSAKRALETAGYFAEEFDIKKKHIIQVNELYEPTVENFLKAVSSLNDKYKTVALFSHNNGITQFANQLTNVQVDDMPTCAVFALRMLNDDWKNFENAEKEFWFFEHPKSIS